MMTQEEVEKNISQMRTLFGGLSVLIILVALGNIYLIISNQGSDGALGALCGVLFGYFIYFAFVFDAYNGLGKLRQKKGYRKAILGSIFLLLGFPILTVFGVIYLYKLSKPEMKAAFQN